MPKILCLRSSDVTIPAKKFSSLTFSSKKFSSLTFSAKKFSQEKFSSKRISLKRRKFLRGEENFFEAKKISSYDINDINLKSKRTVPGWLMTGRSGRKFLRHEENLYGTKKNEENFFGPKKISSMIGRPKKFSSLTFLPKKFSSLTKSGLAWLQFWRARQARQVFLYAWLLLSSPF